MLGNMSRRTTGRTPLRRGGALAKTLVALAGVAAVGGGLFVAVAGEGRQAEAVTSADLVRAGVRDFEITTLATGELEARNKIELRSRLDAQSTIVNVVPEGTRVRAGDLLVELNSDQLRSEIDGKVLEVQEAEFALKSAEAEYRIQLSENASQLRKAQLQVDLAELALQQWRDGDHQLTVTQNQMTVDRTKRDMDRLREKYENSLELHAEQFISRDELQRDEIAKLEAEAAYDKALKEQQIYLEFQYPRDERQYLSDVEEAKAEVLRVQEQNAVNLESKSAAVENRREALRLRQDKLAELRDQLDKTKIYAPGPGLVVYATSLNRDDWRTQQEGPIAVGRTIRPNDLIIVLPDTSEMSASVRVHESIAGRVRPGQPASVSIEAIGQTVRGVVDSIGVLAEGGGWRDPNRREYTVKVRLLPSDDIAARLKPAMRCETRITLGNVEDSIAVPVQAVFQEGPIRYVYTPHGSRFVRQPVQVGRRSDAFAEITAGLAPGDQVLLRQPRAGEVLSQPWDPVALKAAGYEVPGLPVEEPAVPGAATADAGAASAPAAG